MDLKNKLFPVSLDELLLSENDKPMQFRFTELENDVEAEPSPDADFYSDMNRKASDTDRNSDSGNTPKLAGNINDYMIPMPVQRERFIPKPEEKRKVSESGTTAAPDEEQDFRENLDSFMESLGSLGLESPEGGAENYSGISFDTFYADLGPYAKRLQKEIRRNWHPPMAFYTLGLKGDVVIHFYITREGRIDSLEIQKGSSHEPLDRAAYFAIKNSFPFEPLPSFVKEDKLGATITFRYLQGR